MTTAQQHEPSIRPAAPEDLGDLQALARRTIDACYRGFLGDEAVDRFIGSGASDAHVESRLGQGGVSAGLLEDEGPAKLVYTRSAAAPS
ncbi:hypothetical protein ACWF76_18035 [Streptomyces globisporus]